jgi:hypothetical protein
MNNLYNVKISFKGENSFTFTLPGYGDLTVYNGKDIYVKGLSVSGVELLRQLRPLLLEHTLNAKADGCYKVIDLTSGNNSPMNMFLQTSVKSEPTVKSVADLKSDLIKTTGPIVEVESKVDEPKVDLPKEENKEPKKTNVKVEKPVEKNKSKKGLRKSLTKSKK